MTNKDTAEKIFKMVVDSVKKNVDLLPDTTVRIFEESDGTYIIEIGMETVICCDTLGKVIMYNNILGIYPEFGPIPVLTPITDESLGMALLYLTQLRTMYGMQFMKKPNVDISRLITPIEILS